MNLVRRTNLDNAVRGMCPRPVQDEGVFLAMDGINDLRILGQNPVYVKYANLDHLLKVGKVWVGKAGVDPEWMEIRSVKDLPKFAVYVIEDYDACAAKIDAAPYMPQFFFTPTNFRGRKTLKRIR